MNGVEIYRFSKYIPLNIRPVLSTNLSLANGLVSDAIVLNNEMSDKTGSINAVATVYSIGNQIVKQQKVDLSQPQISIDVSSLQKGHYFVKLHIKGTNIFNCHVIKTR